MLMVRLECTPIVLECIKNELNTIVVNGLDMCQSVNTIQYTLVHGQKVHITSRKEMTTFEHSILKVPIGKHYIKTPNNERV